MINLGEQPAYTERLRHANKNRAPGKTGEFTTASAWPFARWVPASLPAAHVNEAYRPDFILVDDIDTDEEVRNPDRVKKKWEWIEQAPHPHRLRFRQLPHSCSTGEHPSRRTVGITRAIEKADPTLT